MAKVVLRLETEIRASDHFWSYFFHQKKSFYLVLTPRSICTHIVVASPNYSKVSMFSCDLKDFPLKKSKYLSIGLDHLDSGFVLKPFFSSPFTHLRGDLIQKCATQITSNRKLHNQVKIKSA